MSPEEFDQYCANVRDSAVWGGEPEILALSRAFNVPIHIIQGAKPHVVIHNPGGDPPPQNTPIVRISYHRRMYGLGEVSYRYHHVQYEYVANSISNNAAL